MPETYKSHIVRVADWPRPGIDCYDIGPLVADPQSFKQIIQDLAEPYRGQDISKVVGIEARGFVLASALAYELGAGVVMIRKKGKIPPPVIGQEYSFEYGSYIMEISEQAILESERIILADDTLATGGTMSAAVKLVQKRNPEIAGISFVVEMDHMAGRDRLRGQNVHSLVHYS